MNGRAVIPLALLLLTACWGKGKPPETVPATSLTVVANLPQGEIEGRASVDVVFDRPVVALGAKDPSLDKGREILRIEPEPKGYYHWVGTRALTFVVNEGLPLATHFKAQVKKGLRAQDGTSLDHDVTWEFTTPRPKVLQSIPAAGDSLIRPGDPFLIHFNQSVDPVRNAEAFELQGGPKLDVSRPDSALLDAADWEYVQSDLDHVVALKPREPLERDHAYTLLIDKSLVGTEGPLPIGDDVRIPFRTYGKPGVVSARAQEGAYIVFRTPVDPDSVRRYLQLEPAPIRPLRVDGGGTEVSVAGLEPWTEYRITVLKGFPDLFGQRADRGKAFTLRTWRRYPSINILPAGNWGETVVLPLDSKREIVLRYTGLTEIKAHVAPVTPEMEARLLSIGDRSFQDSTLRAASFETIYKGRAEDDFVNRAIAVDRFVSPGKPGAVLVAIRGSGVGPQGKADLSRVAVIRWSDLGLTVKSAPNEGLVWATSLGTAVPRPGARFTVLDHTGRPTGWRGTADMNGLSALPGAGHSGHSLFIKAAAGEDMMLGSLGGNGRLTPWALGVTGADMSDSDHRAFVYADRELYRPGETVHLSGFVRRIIPEGLGEATLDSVRVILRDPMGTSHTDTVLALDRLGGLVLDAPLAPETRAGSYWLNATLTQRREPSTMVPEIAIGSASFTVASYRAASFQVKTRLHERTVTAGDRLQAEVQASYFFGSPLRGSRVRWTLTRDRAGIHPPDYEEYAFGDPEALGPGGAVLASGETVLDAAGLARITVTLPTKPLEGYERLMFEAGVQDPTGDTVHGRAAVTYTPASVVPGVRVPDRVVSTEEPVELQVVALRADTTLAAPGTPLRLTLLRREWRSVRKLLIGGRVGFENTTRDSVLGTRDIVSSRSPSLVTWTVRDPGSYRLVAVARDTKGREARAVGSFYVTGKRKQGVLGAWEEDPFLAITLDKKTYRPGETARAVVSTPVHATRAILTIEREAVIESRLVEIEPGSLAFDIPVKASYMPNVYVGVTLVEPELSEAAAPGLPAKARLPRVRIGYAQLSLDVTSRQLTVSTVPDRQEHRPGDNVTVSLRVRTASGAGTPARVSVAVVDEAVHALLNQPDPDPFSFFYAARGLALRNDDTRLRLRLGAEAVLEEGKGDAGGGGEDEPEVRSEFASVAYWHPALFTDTSGNARISFKLPDNLTRYRIVAVAASGADKFGSGKSSIQVTQPLTLDSALPRFAFLGDAFEAAVLVTNRTGRTIQGTVTMETDLDGGKRERRNVRLEAGVAQRVAFPVRAKSVGDARVEFRAEFAGARDALRLLLPVLEPRAPHSAAAAGRTTGSVSETIELPRDALRESCALDLRLSPSIVAGAEEAFIQILDYPHGCLEQESSRLLALTLYKRLLQSTHVSWIDSLSVDAKIRETISKLSAMTLPWGTFAFWPGDPSEAPAWASSYTAYALAQAKRSGAPVPEALLEQGIQLTERGLRGLTQERVKESNRREDQRRESQRPSRRVNGTVTPATTTPTQIHREVPLGILLFTATELEGLTSRSILRGIETDAFIDVADELTAEDRIFVALAMQRLGRHPDFVTKVLGEIKNHVQITAAGATVAATVGSPVPPSLRTGTRGTALLLLLTARARPEDPLATQLAFGLLELTKQGHWGSTQDNLLALLALVEYRERIESTRARPGSVTGTVSLLKRTVLTHAFPSDRLQVVEREAIPIEIKPGTPVTLAFDRQGSEGTLYYGAVLRWEEPALGRAPEEGGFSLVRRIEPLNGSTRAPDLGDLVAVTLEIVVPRETWYLALRDPVPGGLEIVHTGFAVESQVEAQRLASHEGRYERLPVTYTDARDREHRVYADHVAPGVFEFRYLARVRARGEFGHPGATIEAMYSPELSASSGSTSFRTSR